MNVVSAIFSKQLSDLKKNVGLSSMYIMFPVLAFIMGNVMGDMDAFAGQFAAMFIGTVPMIAIAMCVAEDVEHKSLRFMVMAGVKPPQYLFGLAGFVIVMAVIPLALFAIMGEYSGTLLLNFVVIALLGLIASSILGAAIGIFSKNIQHATALYTPVMFVLAMLPMFAGANETLFRIAELLFSFQIFVIIFDPEPDLLRSYIIVAVNIIVLLGFFIFAYKKKGLKG